MKALSGKKFNICLPFIAAIYQTQLNFLGLYHFLSKESIDRFIIDTHGNYYAIFVWNSRHSWILFFVGMALMNEQSIPKLRWHFLKEQPVEWVVEYWGKWNSMPQESEMIKHQILLALFDVDKLSYKNWQKDELHIYDFFGPLNVVNGSKNI